MVREKVYNQLMSSYVSKHNQRISFGLQSFSVFNSSSQTIKGPNDPYRPSQIKNTELLGANTELYFQLRIVLLCSQLQLLYVHTDRLAGTYAASYIAIWGSQIARYFVFSNSYRIAGFSARLNFCEASISLPSSNICDYYIYEPIHSSNHVIA